MSTSRELRLAAALISGSIVASRLLGFVREMVLAALMGAGRETDAYLAAFVVPDIINHFLAGGALSTALLPIFARRLVGGDDERAWQLVNTVVRIATLVLLVALTAGWFLAEPIVRVWYPGFDESQVELTAYLTRVILPGPLFFTAGALLNATEQARKRFVATALMPLVYNLCIILGGVLGHQTLGIAGFSWGVLVGAVLGPFLVPLIASRDVARITRPLSWSDADVRRFFFNAAPVLLSSSLMFFDEWLGRRFASELDAGAITWLNNARRLMLLPAAIVGQAIGQAAFPFLARLLNEDKGAEAARTLDGVFRGTLALALVAGSALFVAADPAVDVVYQRGAYTPADAAETAALLALLAFAVPGWSIYSVALRALHASERMWTSSAIGLGTLVPSWFVYGALAREHGVEGIAVATAACITGGALAMLAAVHATYRHAPWPAVLRGALEGLALGGLGAGAWYGSTAIVGDASSMVVLLVGASAFTVTAGAGLVALPGPAGDAIRRRLKRRR